MTKVYNFKTLQTSYCSRRRLQLPGSDICHHGSSTVEMSDTSGWCVISLNSIKKKHKNMRKQRCITVTLNLANFMQHSVKRTNRLKKRQRGKGNKGQREMRLGYLVSFSSILIIVVKSGHSKALLHDQHILFYSITAG